MEMRFSSYTPLTVTLLRSQQAVCRITKEHNMYVASLVGQNKCSWLRNSESSQHSGIVQSTTVRIPNILQYSTEFTLQQQGGIC